MDLDITPEQIAEFEAGGKVHKVFHHLNADQREFILSGITPEEWKEYIGSDEDEDPSPHDENNLL
jgi:hypothetical protein